MSEKEEEQKMANELEVSMTGKKMIHLHYLKRAMVIMERMIQCLGSGLILYDRSINPFRANWRF